MRLPFSLHVAAQVKVASLIIDIGKTTRHTCGEVHAHAAKHYNATARHVFATMVAHAFAHQEHTRVTDTEAFTRETVDEDLTRGSTITDDVTNR